MRKIMANKKNDRLFYANLRAKCRANFKRGELCGELELFLNARISFTWISAVVKLFHGTIPRKIL